MRMTDGNKTVEIKIKRWNGSGYDPDFANDYFDAGCLPYDDETDTYKVNDVDYCIDYARDEFADDEDMTVFVEEI